MLTWPVKQVQAQPLEKHHVMEPPEEDVMMSGALPVEKIASDFESTPEGNERDSESAYEEVSPVWGLC